MESEQSKTLAAMSANYTLSQGRRMAMEAAAERKAKAAMSPAAAAYTLSAERLVVAQNAVRSIQDKIDAQETIERALSFKFMEDSVEPIGDSDVQELRAVRSRLSDLRSRLKDAQSAVAKLRDATQALADDVAIEQGRFECVSSETLRRKGIRDPQAPEVRHHYAGR